MRNRDKKARRHLNWSSISSTGWKRPQTDFVYDRLNETAARRQDRGEIPEKVLGKGGSPTVRSGAPQNLARALLLVD